eukprot:gene2851-1836_t
MGLTNLRWVTTADCNNPNHPTKTGDQIKQTYRQRQPVAVNPTQTQEVTIATNNHTSATTHTIPTQNRFKLKIITPKHNPTHHATTQPKANFQLEPITGSNHLRKASEHQSTSQRRNFTYKSNAKNTNTNLKRETNLQSKQPKLPPQYLNGNINYKLTAESIHYTIPTAETYRTYINDTTVPSYPPIEHRKPNTSIQQQLRKSKVSIAQYTTLSNKLQHQCQVLNLHIKSQSMKSNQQINVASLKIITTPPTIAPKLQKYGN